MTRVKWSEILDHARVAYLDDAAVQISGIADQQWTDDVLLRYAKEGQEDLARKVWAIYDGGAGFGAYPFPPTANAACFTSSGLVITAPGSPVVKTTLGFTAIANGVFVTVAANAAMPALPGTVVSGQYCPYVLSVDQNKNLAWTQGTTGTDGTRATMVFPQVTTLLNPQAVIGYIVVFSANSTFVGNTTALDAAGVSVTYVDTPNVNTGNQYDQNGQPLCQIVPVNGQSNYLLNDLILDVQRVRISDTDLYLREVGTKDAQPGGPYLDQPVTPSFVNPYVENHGRPIWWETMASPSSIRFRPTVDIRQLDGSINAVLEGPTPSVIYLDVYRLPIYPVDTTHLDRSPEVDNEFHFKLAAFIAGRALTRTANVDAESKKVGKDLIVEWNDELAEMRRDILRKKLKKPQWRMGGWVNDGTGNTW